MVKLNNDWDNILADEFSKEYYIKLREFLKKEYKNNVIFPHMNDIFNALRLTSFANTKVVILGQDPYHGENQAHGLSFSVKNGVALPPSLVNIYKEIEREFSVEMPKSGELVSWAKQGVLLLNTVLTVRKAQPNSHKGMGWENLTDAIIKKLDGSNSPIVFMLWGNNAKSKAKLINSEKHLVLQSVHPSPLSAYNGFFGCEHFKLANNFLAENSLSPINWEEL